MGVKWLDKGVRSLRLVPGIASPPLSTPCVRCTAVCVDTLGLLRSSGPDFACIWTSTTLQHMQILRRLSLRLRFPTTTRGGALVSLLPLVPIPMIRLGGLRHSVSLPLRQRDCLVVSLFVLAFFPPTSGTAGFTLDDGVTTTSARSLAASRYAKLNLYDVYPRAPLCCACFVFCIFCERVCMYCNHSTAMIVLVIPSTKVRSDTRVSVSMLCAFPSWRSRAR